MPRAISEHRLLYVVGQLAGGGLERQLWYLISALDRERYRPAVAVWDYDSEAVYARKLTEIGVPIYAIKRRGGFGMRLLRLRRLVRGLRPEVLHSYSFPTNFPAWYAMLGGRGVSIGSLRNEYQAERTGVGRIGGALCAMFPRVLIANNRVAQEEAQRHKGFTAPGRVEFIPNALDLDQYPNRRFPSGERFEIVGIGRLSEQKNWKDTLTALAKFGRMTDRPWRFRLCGNGPLEQSLRNEAARLEIADRVDFLGFCSDVPAILAESHVMVLSSTHEGTPNVVLESLAVGRPTVATDVGDISRLIHDGREGYLVATRDTDSMAERLKRFASDAELLATMGRAARRRAVQESSLTALVERTLDAYREAGWRDELC